MLFVFLLLGSLAACDRGARGVTEPIVSQITILGGDNQFATEGAKVAAPLSVRVTDGGNEGLPNVKVYWQITSGKGELLTLSDEPLIQGFSVTNTNGVAQVLARFIVRGPNTVAASVTGRPDSQLTFTTLVYGPPDVVIRYSPLFDCTDRNDPSMFQPGDVTVPVGAIVHWVYAQGLPQGCRARVTSSSGPPGGESFDSGPIGPGQVFKFVPRVAGRWEYTDTINGGSGTLTVVAP